MNIRNHNPSWLTALLRVLFLYVVGYAGDLAAAELIKLEVDQTGGTYTIRLEMELDVSADRVQRVLMNYRQLHRLSPSIVESRRLPSPHDGYARVFTRMDSCVLFICRELIRVEDIYQTASGDLVAVIVPGQSDFKAGTALWRITRCGQHTRLVYEASMQPGFFIPPMFGSYLVKKKMEDELLTSINRIECCASSLVGLGEHVPEESLAKIEHSGIC